MNAQTLTPRQARFVGAYTSSVALFNATKSCRLAGYSEKSCRDAGYENLRKPHVRAAIEERFEAACDANEITIEKVLCDLEMTFICAMRDGKYHSAVRAVELQGKYLNMFSTRFKNTHEIEIGQVTEDELANLLIGLLRSVRLRPGTVGRLQSAIAGLTHNV